LDRTVRLLQRAIEVPGLTLELALLLVEYHIRRNEVARKSHAKTWMVSVQGPFRLLEWWRWRAGARGPIGRPDAIGSTG
jgi:hypothetical protein